MRPLPKVTLIEVMKLFSENKLRRASNDGFKSWVYHDKATDAIKYRDSAGLHSIYFPSIYVESDLVKPYWEIEYRACIQWCDYSDIVKETGKPLCNCPAGEECTHYRVMKERAIESRAFFPLVLPLHCYPISSIASILDEVSFSDEVYNQLRGKIVELFDISDLGVREVLENCDHLAKWHRQLFSEE